MADIWVPRHGLGDGDLPAVCVRTGLPADGLVDVRFRPMPGWIVVLLFFGFFPFLVGVALGSDLVVGQLPVTHHVVERHHRLGRWATALAATAIAIVGLGVAVGSAVASGVGVAVGVASLGLLAWRSATWVRARPDRTGIWVRLQGVHDDFVAVAAANDSGRP